MAEIKILRNNDHEHIDADWGSLDWYASRELGNSGEMTFGLCTIKPGHSNPLHLHPNCEEILHVAQGRILHTGPDGKDVEMNVGDTVAVPANTPHHAQNIGDTDAVLWITFSSADRQFEKVE